MKNLRLKTSIFSIALTIAVGIFLSFTAFAEEILPPRNVQAHVGFKDKLLVRLDWQPSETPGVDAYRVYRRELNQNEYTLIDTLAVEANFYIDGNDIKETRNYVYEVRSVKDDIEGPVCVVSTTSRNKQVCYRAVVYGYTMNAKNYVPYFYPSINGWAYLGDELIIRVKGYDPDGDNVTYSFDFPADPKRAEFVYNFSQGVYEFRWKPLEKGAYTVRFRIEDESGLCEEKEVEFVIVNRNEVIYIDDKPFLIKERAPNSESAYPEYQEGCKIIDLNDPSASEKECYIKSGETSFTMEENRIDSINIPADMVLFVINYIRREETIPDSMPGRFDATTYWLEKLPSSQDSKYICRVIAEEAVYGMGHSYAYYSFYPASPINIKHGDLELYDIMGVDMPEETNWIRYISSLYKPGDGNSSECIYAYPNGQDVKINFGGRLWNSGNGNNDYISFNEIYFKKKDAYYDKDGRMVFRYNQASENLEIIAPEKRTIKIAISNDSLKALLETSIICSEVKLLDDGIGYFSEDGKLLFHKKVYEAQGDPKYLPASYEFGEGVELPHLSNKSFVVELKDKVFDIPVKYVDLRDTQNDYIEFNSIKPGTEQQAGEKSLRIYREPTAEGVKYEYVDSNITLKWNKDGELVSGSSEPPEPIESEDIIIHIDDEVVQYRLMNRTPTQGQIVFSQTELDYTQTCNIIEIDSNGLQSDNSIVYEGYIRSENPSFISLRDIRSSLDWAIPITTPGSLTLAVLKPGSWGGKSGSIYWLEKKEGAENEYVCKARLSRNCWGGMGHCIARYEFFSDEPIVIEKGELKFSGMKSVSFAEGAVTLMRSGYYLSEDGLCLKEYPTAEGEEIEFTFGGMLWQDWNSEYEDCVKLRAYYEVTSIPIFILNDASYYAEYFDKNGTRIVRYEFKENHKEEALTFISPATQEFTVIIPAHEIIGTQNLKQALTATVICHNVKEYDGGIGYFDEGGKLLFHKKIYETGSDPNYLPTSYTFGEGVELPHLTNSSLVVELKDKPFDIPVKYADFRPEQNDYIEFSSVKVEGEPQAGEKSLRIYRNLTNMGVKYAYFEGDTEVARWDEKGELILGTVTPQPFPISYGILPPSYLMVNSGYDGERLLMRLDWQQSETPGIEVYRVYREYVLIDEVPGNTSFYIDTKDLIDGGRYIYYITAVKDGFESPRAYGNIAQASSEKSAPYFYPPIEKKCIFQGEIVLIEIKAYDPNNIRPDGNLKYDFRFDYPGATFNVNAERETYEFRWLATEPGNYEVTFIVENDAGLKTEYVVKFIVLKQENEVIYIDGHRFALKERVPQEGVLGGTTNWLYTGYTSYDYQERCSVIDLDGVYFSPGAVVGGYIRHNNPSFVPYRDLTSRMESFRIDLNTPGAFDLAFVKGTGVEILWIDYEAAGKYQTKVIMNATIQMGHRACDYYFLLDDKPNAKLGDILLYNIVEASFRCWNRGDVGGQISYYFLNTDNVLVENISEKYAIRIGILDEPLLGSEIDTGKAAFEMYKEGEYFNRDFFDENGRLFGRSRYSEGESFTYEFINPQNHSYLINIPSDLNDVGQLGLNSRLETVVMCNKIKELDGNIIEFCTAQDSMLLRIRYDYIFNKDVVTIYEFGDGVEPPHLTNTSFVAELKDKPFDIAVKYADFRPESNDYIEFKDSGQESLRIYRKPTAEGVKYAYLEGDVEVAKWDEKGEIIAEAAYPAIPIEKELIIYTGNGVLKYGIGNCANGGGSIQIYRTDFSYNQTCDVVKIDGDNRLSGSKQGKSVKGYIKTQDPSFVFSTDLSSVLPYSIPINEPGSMVLAIVDDSGNPYMFLDEQKKLRWIYWLEKMPGTENEYDCKVLFYDFYFGGEGHYSALYSFMLENGLNIKYGDISIEGVSSFEENDFMNPCFVSRKTDGVTLLREALTNNDKKYLSRFAGFGSPYIDITLQEAYFMLEQRENTTSQFFKRIYFNDSGAKIAQYNNDISAIEFISPADRNIEVLIPADKDYGSESLLQPLRASFLCNRIELSQNTNSFYNSENVLLFAIDALLSDQGYAIRPSGYSFGDGIEPLLLKNESFVVKLQGEQFDIAVKYIDLRLTQNDYVEFSGVAPGGAIQADAKKLRVYRNVTAEGVKYEYIDSNVTVKWNEAGEVVSNEPLGNPPVASGSTEYAHINTSLEIELRGYDPDAGDTLKYSIKEGPKNGKVEVLDEEKGLSRYTPNTDYAGKDSFIYTVTDSTGLSDEATVAITVIGYRAPMALGIEFTTLMNTPLEITLSKYTSDSDPGDVLTYSIGIAEHGKVELLDDKTGKVTYTPDKDYAGWDSFTYTATDLRGLKIEMKIPICVIGSHNSKDIIIHLGSDIHRYRLLSSKTDIDAYNSSGDFSYEDVCRVIPIDEKGNPRQGYFNHFIRNIDFDFFFGNYIKECHIQTDDISFVFSRDLNSKLPLSIPINTPGSMKITVGEGSYVPIYWLEKINSSSNEYLCRAVRYIVTDTYHWMGCWIPFDIETYDFYPAQPLNVEFGDISLTNVTHFYSSNHYGTYFTSSKGSLYESRQGSYEWNFDFRQKLWWGDRYMDASASGGGVDEYEFKDCFKHKSHFIKYTSDETWYYDEGGIHTASYNDREEVFTYINPPERQLSVGIPNHKDIGTGDLATPLQINIDCHQVKEYDGGVGYFNEEGGLLFHKKVSSEIVNYSYYLPASYTFGEGVELPHLSNNSFVIELKDKPFDLPVKYVNFVGIYIEFKSGEEPQKSLRVYREPTAEGVKYEYIEYTTATEGTIFSWNENGELISSSIGPVPVKNPPIARDFTVETKINTAAEIDLSKHASDPDAGDTLKYSIKEAPDHGKIELLDDNTGKVRYTPDRNYYYYVSGDSFTYTVTDSAGLSDSGKVTIIVMDSTTPPAVLPENNYFRTNLETYEEFMAISGGGGNGDYNITANVPFLIPTEQVTGAPAYTVFINVNPMTCRLSVPFHWYFLAEAINPDTRIPFRPGLDVENPDESYFPMVLYRNGREYFDGRLFEIQNGNESFLGFNILAAPGAPDELLEQEEVEWLYNHLRGLIGFSEDIRYAPFETDAQQKARTYVNPAFPIYYFNDGAADVEYEGYSLAASYGYLRLYTLDEFTSAIQNSQIGWQDIVVIDTAPTDIDVVVAGVITGTKQGPLSHINVRMTARGTPNAYIKDALTTLSQYKDKLVRLEVKADDYAIKEVSIDEAERFWSQSHPAINIPDPDDSYDAILCVNDPGFNVEECTINRFGGKSSNLARLYQTIDKQYQSEAVFIPFYYYANYINSSTMTLDEGEPYYDVFGKEAITFAQYISHFLNDEKFKTDLAYRKAVLDCLCLKSDQTQERIDYELTKRVKDALTAEFGINFSNVQEKDYLRFRSSSNIEDALEFSGAGLYDSVGIFNGKKERKDPDSAIMKGLVGVWQSLWTLRAVEERMYYNIDQTKARMGVLITRGYDVDTGNEELANGIANTFDQDYKGEGYAYTINVQFGDSEVAQPVPGIYPEIDRIIVHETGYGADFEIERVRKSSLPDAPEQILTDEQLNELGEIMFQIDKEYDCGDLKGYRRDQVMLEIEFKLRPDNTFLIKQVRPLLKPGAVKTNDTTAIVVTTVNTVKDIEESDLPILLLLQSLFGPRGDLLKMTITETTSHGKAEVLSDGKTIRYTPAEGYAGKDNFSVLAEFEKVTTNYNIVIYIAEGIIRQEGDDDIYVLDIPEGSGECTIFAPQTFIDSGTRVSTFLSATVFSSYKEYIGQINTEDVSFSFKDNTSSKIDNFIIPCDMVLKVTCQNPVSISIPLTKTLWLKKTNNDIAEEYKILVAEEAGGWGDHGSSTFLFSTPLQDIQYGDIRLRYLKRIILVGGRSAEPLRYYFRVSATDINSPETDFILLEEITVRDTAIRFVLCKNDDSREIIACYDDQGILIGNTNQTGQMQADFTADPENGPAPLLVKFADKSIGDITTWQWNFGDSYARWNTSTEKTPAHNYIKPGTYTVTLTVTGPRGTATAKHDIEVFIQTGYGRSD